MAAIGRPSDFTQDIADRICAELSEGKSLRKVCQADDLPSARTVFRWLRTNEEFCQQYAKAKEECADMYAEEIIEISDDSTRDYLTGENGLIFNSEHVQRSRLRVDSRKWIASKLKPKKYGDKVAVGGDADAPPIQTVTEIVIRAVDANRPTQESG